MHIPTAEQLYIVNVANRSGRMAVIEGGSVAIFTPSHRDVSEGAHHVSYRVDRVRTLAECWTVLAGEARQWQDELDAARQASGG